MGKDKHLDPSVQRTSSTKRFGLLGHGRSQSSKAASLTANAGGFKEVRTAKQTKSKVRKKATTSALLAQSLLSRFNRSSSNPLRPTPLVHWACGRGRVAGMQSRAVLSVCGGRVRGQAANGEPRERRGICKCDWTSLGAFAGHGRAPVPVVGMRAQEAPKCRCSVERVSNMIDSF